jgi:hypothetical protein
MSTAELSKAPPRIPCWGDVEELLDRLAATHAAFPTVGARNARIGSYDRGRRLALDSDAGSQWVAWENIRGCWETFERLGSIHRQDVLDPGRCSAFMIALFQRVPGVAEHIGEDRYLVLPA